MRAEFDASWFKAAFGMAAAVVPSRTPKPALQNVLLTVLDDQHATFTGNDMEVMVVANVPVLTSDGAWRALLPADRFGAILRTWGDAAIPIERDGDNLAVGSGRSRFKLATTDPDVFPEFQAGGLTPAFAIEAGKLDVAFRRTAFATDVDSARYALGGVLLEIEGGEASAVATDGRRLAWVKLGVEPSADIKPNRVVVPVKAVKAIAKATDAFGASVAVEWSESAVAFRGESATILCRAVDGRFPRWRDVFPDGVKVKAVVAAGVLRRAADQAAVATSDESRGVDFDLAPGVLSLRSAAADVGSSAVDVDVMTDADVREVAFALDPRYVVDMLRTLDDDASVTIGVVDSRSGVTFDVDGYSYVTMPLTREA